MFQKSYFLLPTTQTPNTIIKNMSLSLKMTRVDKNQHFFFFFDNEGIKQSP